MIWVKNIPPFPPPRLLDSGSFEPKSFQSSGSESDTTNGCNITTGTQHCEGGKRGKEQGNCSTWLHCQGQVRLPCETSSEEMEVQVNLHYKEMEKKSGESQVCQETPLGTEEKRSCHALNLL